MKDNLETAFGRLLDELAWLVDWASEPHNYFRDDQLFAPIEAMRDIGKRLDRQLKSVTKLFDPQRQYFVHGMNDQPLLNFEGWEHVSYCEIAMELAEAAQRSISLVDVKSWVSEAVPFANVSIAQRDDQRSFRIDVDQLRKLVTREIRLAIPTKDTSGWIALSPAEMRLIFDIEQDALLERLANQFPPNTKVTTKSYFVDPDFLPSGWKKTIGRE